MSFNIFITIVVYNEERKENGEKSTFCAHKKNKKRMPFSQIS